MRLIFTLFFVLLFSVKIKTQAQPTITLTEFASGLTTVVDITNCGDERLFAVQKGGKIKIVDLNGNVTATPFLDIDPKVKSNGNEQGLLGLAFHPELCYKWIFICELYPRNRCRHSCCPLRTRSKRPQ